MYNHTTVQGATFNLCDQLHANATVVQWSVHWAPSWTTQVLVLARARCCALETCGGKKMWVPLLGLAKSIYYLGREREEWIWILLKLELFQASFLFSAGISSLVIPFPSGHGDHNLCILVWCRTETPASFDISFFLTDSSSRMKTTSLSMLLKTLKATSNVNVKIIAMETTLRCRLCVRCITGQLKFISIAQVCHTSLSI